MICNHQNIDGDILKVFLIHSLIYFEDILKVYPLEKVLQLLLYTHHLIYVVKLIMLYMPYFLLV